MDILIGEVKRGKNITPHITIAKINQADFDKLMSATFGFQDWVHKMGFDYKYPLLESLGGGQNSNTVAKHIIEYWGFDFRLPAYTTYIDKMELKGDVCSFSMDKEYVKTGEKFKLTQEVFAPGVNAKLEHSTWDKLLRGYSLKDFTGS